MKKALTIGLVLFILLSGISVNTVEGQLLLEITKKAEPEALIQGEQLTITVKVENKGIREFFNVKVTDTIPKGFELISGTTSIERDSLKPGESLTLEYVLKALEVGDFIFDSATVTYEGRFGVHYSKTSNTIEVHVVAPPPTPYIRINPISPVVVGEPLDITGVTNLADETAIFITIEGPAEIPAKTVYVENGVFKATFDTTDAIPGTYTVTGDDGEGHTDTVTMEILAPIPQGIIKGNVYDAETGFPIEAATVTCQRGYCKIVDGATICTLCIPPQAEKTTTDSNGYFEFSDLETTWVYNITVKCQHYKTKSVEIPLISEEKYISIDLQPLSPLSFGVDLSCPDTNKSVLREEKALYTIIVQNTGDRLDTINLTIPPSTYPPPPCGWADISLSKYQVTLPPGDSTEVILYVGPFTRYYGSSKTAIVTGTSQGDPTMSDSITTITTIIPPTTPAPPTPTPTLQSLTIDIEPKFIQAEPRQYVPYLIKINWSPKEWSGTIDTRLKVKGFDIEKKYSFDTQGITPPFESYKYAFCVPEVPPATYTVILTATADGMVDTTETRLTVTSETSAPGFEAIFAIASLLAVVAYLLRKKK